MTLEPKLPKCCSEVPKEWNLQKLFDDLIELKKKLGKSKVTNRYKEYVCLLLNNKEYKEMAQNLPNIGSVTNKKSTHIKSNTAKEKCLQIYDDINKLLKERNIQITDGVETTKDNFVSHLLKAGYYRGNNTPNLDTLDLYVERPPDYIKRGIEEQVCQAIKSGGSLIRIKGLKQIGKTSLLEEIIIPEAKEAKYRTASLSLNAANLSDSTNTETFLQWFCDSIVEKLGLQLNSNQYWERKGTENDKATNHLEGILQEIKQPLLVALDNIDNIFAYSQMAQDFCQLLRLWKDKANKDQCASPLWKNLRLVILHSTEEYAKLKNFMPSPFDGLGKDFTLKEFNKDQVKELTRRYQLSWSNDHIDRLIDLVEGHPFLINKAFKEFGNQDINPDIFWQQLSEKVYKNHLLDHLSTLEQQPKLKDLFSQIIHSEEQINPVNLDPILTYQLERMGLVKLELVKLEDEKAQIRVSPRCQLYRLYFSQYCS